MTAASHKARMKNGAGYEVHLCLDPELHFTRAQLKDQIRKAVAGMSPRSRWQRFAAPVSALSEEQLDYLTSLDGRDRVAWCAVIDLEEPLRGIGLARYARLRNEPRVAEFAVTVVDEFQGQGIGRTLLERLSGSAEKNQIETLRGFVTPGNRKMLALSRHFNARLTPHQNCMCIEIPLPLGSVENHGTHEKGH